MLVATSPNTRPLKDVMSHSEVNPQMAVAPSSSISCQGKSFRIALVVKDRQDVKMGAIHCASSPLTNCRIAYLAVVSPLKGDESDDDLLRRYYLQPGSATVFRGAEGFQQALKSDADAFYIYVPKENQRDFVVNALNANKHVLLDDPESTDFNEFKEQLACARKHNRFIQFATMFVHQHRVLSFLECVRAENFGSIESIDVLLTLNVRDVSKVGVRFPLREGHGCIRRLGRYCALISSLMLTKGHVKTRPYSAQVKNVLLSDTDEPLQAYCVVKFSDKCILKFTVAYSHAATRQVLEVRSKDRYAQITDFVIPNRDGLSTYRIYDKSFNATTGQLEVVRGEALDVPEGPSQDVMMWTRFRDISQSIEDEGWVDNPKTQVARQVTAVALQTKRILTALHQSIERDGAEVLIASEDCDLDC